MLHEFNSRSAIIPSLGFIVTLLLAVVGLRRWGNSVPAEGAGFCSAIETPSRPNTHVEASSPRPAWTDRWGDGFPDVARLDREQDRESFVRWITFLAEAQYYQPTAAANDEIDDCAALVRFAYRNALAAHTPAWRRSVSLPYDPGFPDIAKFAYPEWPLGRGLFRIWPGPFDISDVERGAFGEFADSATLLHYNSFFISRDVGAARPGDLMFFNQPGERQPYHSMLFVGRSSFQTQGAEWIVYHTGDLDGHRGKIREVDAALLTRHPDPHWRPLESNPRFLGIYRFALLR